MKPELHRGYALQKYTLELIVFCSGAVVMILELVGARILAPYLGTSIVVWTGLIGIVLASLSIGYGLGGKYADKGPTMVRLSMIILVSGFLIAVCVLIQKPVLTFLAQSPTGIYLNVLLATTVLFGPPSVGLGMITPYAVKMKIKNLETSGSAVGRMYALSTIGSIVGTFLSGFVLVAFFASASILFFLVIIMGLLSFMASVRPVVPAKAALLVIGILGIASVNLYRGFAEEYGFFDIDSRYNRIQIYQGLDQEDGRMIRVVSTSPDRYQSAMYLDDPTELVLEYTRYFRLIKHFNPDIEKALMLGGGAYSFPKHFLKAMPHAGMDVVEIDPMFTRLARDHFFLEDNPRLSIIHQDARTFLNNCRQKYDAVIADVFSGSYYIPFQMTTKEALTGMYDILNDNGVVAMNIISSVKGLNSRFFQAQFITFQEVFPQVFAFIVDGHENPETVRNIVIVASRSDAGKSMNSEHPELDRMLQNLWRGEFEYDLPVLTDNYAPVDRYLIPVIN